MSVGTTAPAKSQEKAGPQSPLPDHREPAGGAVPAEPAAGEASVGSDEPRVALRSYWQQISAMTISAVVHMVALVTLGVLVVEPKAITQVQEVLAQVLDEIDKRDELKVELENQLSDVHETSQVFSSSPLAGVVGVSGPQVLISAPTMDRAVLEQVVNSSINVEGVFVDVPSSRKLIVEAPDGQVGEARAVVGSYADALDRITQEILWMLDKGPVLVVWAFDQSESMKDDQKEIRDRIEHVYTELGLLNKANEHALETAVVSYGDAPRYKVHTPPTYDRSAIMSAIDAVPNDASGKEFMCSAVIDSISRHRQYAQRTRRQMALILVTDESGERPDNETNLERAIAEAKSARCRVYVLGREAVFGYPYVHLRWVHPQTKRVHWLPIDRGPETAYVEQLQTDGFRRRYDAHPSGFGPYECTRLGRETGGIFFMLPSLETNLVRGEKRNYDMEAPYYPDLRTRLEVKADIESSKMRTMLEKVIYDLNPYNAEARRIIEMRVEFSTNYDTLAQQLRQETSKAAVYLPYLARAEETVGKMQDERRYEASPRWQANYDLLYAQLIAYQARMYEYSAYLEEFLQDLQVYSRSPGDPKNKFKPPPKTKSPNLIHDEWHIRTRQRTITGSKVQPYIDRATMQFREIIKNHPGTPWAARAEYELKRGFGVELVPWYDTVHPDVKNPLPIPKM
jgi:hypothetical protein